MFNGNCNPTICNEKITLYFMSLSPLQRFEIFLDLISNMEEDTASLAIGDLIMFGLTEEQRALIIDLISLMVRG